MADLNDDDVNDDEVTVDELQFDYTLIFPSLSARATGAGDDKDPVVFLFGWAGCNDKYLKKYASLYENEGCITIQYTAPVPMLFWRPEELSDIGEKIYDLLEDLELQGHRIIFHLFSGCGCTVFNAFYDSLSAKDDASKIKEYLVGLVFDSCPGWGSYHSRSLAYVESAYGEWSPAFRNLWFFVSFFLFWMSDTFSWITKAIAGGRGRKSYRESMLVNKDLPQIPQLYLFSKADQFCVSSAIEAFIADQKLKGSTVESICWEDSPHCGHLKAHPQEYATAVVEFVQKVCSRASGSDEPDLESFVQVDGD